MRALAAATALAALLAGCASGPPPLPPGAADWEWEGRLRIDSLVEVPPGVTLRLAPGTVLEFPFDDRDGDGYGDNGLHVRGRIVALGEEGRPVVLTSGEKSPRPGDWAGLLLDDSRENLFERCTIEYARYGLHTHFSGGRILRSRLVRNVEGTRLGDSRFEIGWSLVAGNTSKGVNFRACANRIHHNTITGNGHGIFLFETDTESVIEENNIHGNEGCDFRLGDFYRGGVTVRRNWWGTGDVGEIRRRICEGEGAAPGERVRIDPAGAPRETGWEGGAGAP